MTHLYFRSFEESRLHICHGCEKPNWRRPEKLHQMQLAMFVSMTCVTDMGYCMACAARRMEACLHGELCMLASWSSPWVRRGGTIPSDLHALSLIGKLAMVLFGGSLPIRSPSLPDNVSQLIIDCLVGDPNPAIIGNRRSRHRHCLYVLLANGNHDLAHLAFFWHRPSPRDLLAHIIAFAV